MYHIKREYECDICGKVANERVKCFFEAVKFFLPYGWSGSRKKYGECFCDECTKSIKKLKENQS